MHAEIKSTAYSMCLKPHPLIRPVSSRRGIDGSYAIITLRAFLPVFYYHRTDTDALLLSIHYSDVNVDHVNSQLLRLLFLHYSMCFSLNMLFLGNRSNRVIKTFCDYETILDVQVLRLLVIIKI